MRIGWEIWEMDEGGENPWDKGAFRGVPYRNLWVLKPRKLLSLLELHTF